MDPSKTRDSVDKAWDQSIIPALQEYIRIPALSPAFGAVPPAVICRSAYP